MKHLFYIFLLSISSVFSQETIETTLIEKTPLSVETLVSVDNFGSTYYINNNVFYKKTQSNTVSYNNLQLGYIFSANAFNPLKINVFYKEFNSVIILDNRLAEVFKIDFNMLTPYKNISHVSTGFDNTLWVFNQDLQKLELFDYKTRTWRAQTAPVQSEVLDVKSNYNYCWLLTKNYLYVYNYFGSLVKKIKNNGFTGLEQSNENVILRKDHSLFYLNKNSETPIPVVLPNLLIKHFFVTNETLYIYDGKTLLKYQILTD